MLKIIAGVMKPTRGSVKTSGVIAPLIELGAGFDFDLTAKENVFLNGTLLGYTREYLEEHYEEIVEFSELEQFMDVPVKNFSIWNVFTACICGRNDWAAGYSDRR